jgi:hypothetical protein
MQDVLDDSTAHLVSRLPDVRGSASLRGMIMIEKERVLCQADWNDQ